jgi:hypothetical protein
MNDFIGKTLQIIMFSTIGVTTFKATYIKENANFLVVKRDYINSSSIEYLALRQIISIRIIGEATSHADK